MVSDYVIRSVEEDDLDELFRLSKLVYFINLPEDRGILKEKILTSVQSFCGEIEDKFAREYIFVLEERKTKKIVGTSMIIARHGSPDSPHMYFEIKELQKYSETIHTGFIHKVLRLKFDYDGPTEIGGLVVDPDYRNSPEKLGKQLSFARFLYIKMKRRWFKDRILSELMPPLTNDGESILWEAVGRKFTSLSYEEADILSRKNKEFVTSLFPRRDIYVCLLPGEVRDAIGKVGPQTKPVQHMLEKIGFEWRHHVDPFDGGPHFWADTDKISLIKETKKLSLSRQPLNGKQKVTALVGQENDGVFRCIQTTASSDRGYVRMPPDSVTALGIEEGEKAKLFFMPLE